MESLNVNVKGKKKKREKVEGIKKWRKIKNYLKSINYFYILLQTFFHRFNSSIYGLNNLKICKKI